MGARRLFGGPDVDRDDEKRLLIQLAAVRQLMHDQSWRTLGQIFEFAGGSEAGVSARLRDLRKKKFGSHIVERRRIGGKGGLWEYRVLDPNTLPDSDPRKVTVRRPHYDVIHRALIGFAALHQQVNGVGFTDDMIEVLRWLHFKKGAAS